MKLRRLLGIALLTVMTAGGLIHLYRQANDGFTMTKIAHERTADPRWETAALSLQEQAQLATLLRQRFSYLGKGHQAFVFLSADGNYVLKFFKYPPIRDFEWLNHLSWLPPVANYQERHLKRNAERMAYLDSLHASWKLAYEELPEQTGTLYVHLNRTDGWLGQTTLVDRLGIPHVIDLDEAEFLVQRCAQMLGPTLEAMIARGEQEQARLLIDRLVGLIESDYGKGLADNDHALLQNTGLVDGRPIHVDTGMLARTPWIADPVARHRTLLRHTAVLQRWLDERAPELASFLDERLGPTP